LAPLFPCGLLWASSAITARPFQIKDRLFAGINSIGERFERKARFSHICAGMPLHLVNQGIVNRNPLEPVIRMQTLVPIFEARNHRTACAGRYPKRMPDAEAVHTIGAAESQLPSIFSVAAAWMKRLQSEVEAGAALNALVDRVELTDTGIRVSLRLPNSITEEQRGANATALTITRVFPMQIRRRGFEMRLVIQGSRAPAPLADLALLKAIARGRQWADNLLAARVESVAAIAKCEGVLPNYVRRLTRLAFVAPRIVEAIAAGHQPPELTAKALTERIELPLLWSEQERAVGMS